MAYDDDLAARIRDVLADEPDLDERRMFGGLAFLIGGHMTVCAVSRGGLMVRAGDAAADLLSTTEATQVEMGTRTMTGWLEVAAEHLRDEADLTRWVDVGRRAIADLPPKRR